MSQEGTNHRRPTPIAVPITIPNHNIRLEELICGFRPKAGKSWMSTIKATDLDYLPFGVFSDLLGPLVGGQLFAESESQLKPVLFFCLTQQ